MSVKLPGIKDVTTAPPQDTAAPSHAAFGRSSQAVPSSSRRSTRQSQRRGGAPLVQHERPSVTSWPARSGQTADLSAGPNLSAHLHLMSGSAHSAESSGAATARVRSTKSTATDEHGLPLPPRVATVAGGGVRPRTETSLPHLVTADRPSKTARVSTAAASEGVRNKPPLVVELEAFIRRELRILGHGASRGGASTAATGAGRKNKSVGHSRLDGNEADPFPPPPQGSQQQAALQPTPPSTAASHTSTALVVASSAVAQPRATHRFTVASKHAESRPVRHGTSGRDLPADSGLPTSDSVLAPGSSERLVVFTEAYRTLAEHFSEYEDLMLTIKAEFDAAIRDGEAQRLHARELERELATAHGYVSYIVEAETEKLQRENRDMESEIGILRKRLAKTEHELADSIALNNRTQADLDRSQTEVAEGHQRNKLLADALRNDAERQAAVAANLSRLRKENERLQKYSKALEDKSRDDALVIEQLQDALKDLGRGVDVASISVPQDSPSVSTALPQSEPHTAHLSDAKSPMRVSRPPSSAATRGGLSTSIAKMQSAALSVVHHQPPTKFVGVAQQLLNSSTRLNESPEHSLEVSTEDRRPRVGGTDATIDRLEEELILARERAKKYQRVALQLQKTNQHQRKRLDALLSRRGDRPMTPRPNWSSLHRQIPDFNPSVESTSDQLLEDLSAHIDSLKNEHRVAVEAQALSRAVREWLADEELCESDLASFGKTFVGRGTGPQVPPFFRWHGRVRNKRLRKGDVERLLKTFWADRDERRRAEGSDSTRIAEFTLEWLSRTTGSPPAGIELAYNMLHVCEMHRYDPDCSLFADIVMGRLCEDAYFESQSSLAHLQRVIRAADKKCIGTLPRTTLFRLVRKLYPGKSHEHMLQLRYALVAHSTDDGVVSYFDLFDEDTNGNQTRFVECLRRQHVEEAQEFAVDVEEAIRASSSSYDAISLAEARRAIKDIDPAMPDAPLSKILGVGFSVPPDSLNSLEERTKVQLDAFLSRIRSQAFMRRFSPKPLDLPHVERTDNDPVLDSTARSAAGLSPNSADAISDLSDDSSLSGEEIGQL